MASLDVSDSSSRKQLSRASFRHRGQAGEGGVGNGLLGASFGHGGGGQGQVEALTGIIKVEKVLRKSVATRVYARYPLKYLVPSKIAISSVDCAWIYAISYGGGILANDVISQGLDIGGSCSVVMTTQSSTKIYKSVKPGTMAQQLLHARVAAAGFLALLPDPITCFRASRYVQLQEFVLAVDASLLLVDWLTSGRIDSGESWDFELYRSTNHIFVEEEEEEDQASGNSAEKEARESGSQEQEARESDDSYIAPVVTLDSGGGSGSKRSSKPLLLDCLHLENGVGLSIAERMQGFHVMATVVIYGPQLLELRKKMETKVEEMTKQAFNQRRSSAFTASLKKNHGPPRTSLPKNGTSDGGDGNGGVSNHPSQQPLIFASCSPIAVSDNGLIVRIVASSTEVVYDFLREQLATIFSLIGACPYAGR